jgi:hypothetical protein
MICIQRSKKAYAESERYERATSVEVYDMKAADPEDGSQDYTCVICLADFEVGDSVRRLACRHLFHKTCVDEYFNRQLSQTADSTETVLKTPCPVCRQDILKAQVVLSP